MLAVPPRVELTRRPLETERLTLHAIDIADAPELWQAVDL